jgi:hypothetical protein
MITSRFARMSSGLPAPVVALTPVTCVPVISSFDTCKPVSTVRFGRAIAGRR